MRILAAGGGSGGHVTPVVAVLREIKERYPDAEIRFWCDHKFGATAEAIMKDFDASITVQKITSGKLRRYHHLSLWQQLIKFRTIVLPNAVDIAKVGVGIIESLVRMIIWRPDVVFTKGGFVCLPIGMAAHLLRVPLVIHDSDAHPGLTNRLLSRWATAIATGAPLKFYTYPMSKSIYVGVPVRPEFSPYSQVKQAQAKKELGFSPDRPLTVITGGGLGARRLNVAVAKILHELLKSTNVLLISGQTQYEHMRDLTPPDNERYQLHAFVGGNMASVMGAANIVIARAGATTILELAALAKPTILVPNGFLTGGHQLKNAAVYAEKGAVSVVDELEIEKHPELLLDEVLNLLSDGSRTKKMAELFHEFAKPDAAADMATMIIRATK